MADVGIVKSESFVFATKPDRLKLDSGQFFGPITVAYETYGRLSRAKDNVVLLLHALSGDHHAAGRYTPADRKPGWWDSFVGPGKGLDTDKYFVICSNFLGGCMGTTGPSSINPQTNQPYALTFPSITISDMVRVQKALIDHLGISHLRAVIGGSLGGMQALEWTLLYPEIARSAIVIASTSCLSAQAIAFDAVGRNAIMSDPAWNKGNYYGTKGPSRGLAIARMVGHITYLSSASMRRKFGRALRDRTDQAQIFDDEFEVESYLSHQGQSFVERFDANSYLYITKAADYYNISERFGSLSNAFRKTLAKFLVLSFTSDWLFPPFQSQEIVKALMSNDKQVTYCNIQTDYGHDAFLLETETLARLVRGFLDHV
ncbi:MAG: homoserine O-acetyltransferase [Actinobacteria bacterium]|nr:homoserine O-acetyltransferase [Actinomycetota bacterium]